MQEASPDRSSRLSRTLTLGATAAILVRRGISMDAQVREALKTGSIIDITTTGRKSGETRRIEIVFHNLDGHIYISGFPRPKKRAWLANLEANPHFTFHLKTAARNQPAGSVLSPVAADL